MTRQLLSRTIVGCGCPEEEWLVAGLDVLIHFEEGPDGPHADCFVVAGDWDVENRHAGTEDEAREAAFAFIESWPTENEVVSGGPEELS